MNILASIQQTLAREAQAIQAIPLSETAESVVFLLKESTGKIVVSGMGKAGIIAHKVAATLASTGTPAFFIHPGEAQHGDLGAFSANDILLAFSISGKTREIIEMVKLLQNLHPTIPTVVITADENSELAQLADYTLSLGKIQEACPLGLTPTASTTALLALGDALAVAVMELKNFSQIDYAKRHHGGYLGQKARGELN